MKNKKVLLISLVLALVLATQVIPFVAAVSDSDTPAYSYEIEGTAGILGTKVADANKNAGEAECYAYIYWLQCEAWAGIFADQDFSGGYRWRVEADVALEAYLKVWGTFGDAWLYIYIMLLDGTGWEIDRKTVYDPEVEGPGSEDASFSETELVALFSSYDNVEYIGVMLHVIADGDAVICRDSSDVSSDNPAFMEVSEIRWEDY